MAYYFAKSVTGSSFEDVVARTVDALQAQGFGVLTDIDVRATMQKKLGEDFRNYRILGACNPKLALQALRAEDKIGTMLPCNVIVQERDGGAVEVAAIDPRASMQAVENPALTRVAENVGRMLRDVVEAV